MDIIEVQFGEYTISSDKKRLDRDAVFRYLSEEAYWSKKIPRITLEKAIDHAFCVGIYQGPAQIGFCRVITDFATFGYLADVYVLTEHRGKGLSKAMMAAIMDLDWVKGLRRFTLATVDAHGLYSQYGFSAPKFPDRLMEIVRPKMYEKETD